MRFFSTAAILLVASQPVAALPVGSSALECEPRPGASAGIPDVVTIVDGVVVDPSTAVALSPQYVDSSEVVCWDIVERVFGVRVRSSAVVVFTRAGLADPAVARLGQLVQMGPEAVDGGLLVSVGRDLGPSDGCLQLFVAWKVPGNRVPEKTPTGSPPGEPILLSEQMHVCITRQTAFVRGGNSESLSETVEFGNFVWLWWLEGSVLPTDPPHVTAARLKVVPPP